MNLQDNLKALKDYINYKAIMIGLIVFTVSYSIIFTFFEQYAGFTRFIPGLLLVIQLQYMIKTTKEWLVNLSIILVISYLVMDYLFDFI